MVAGAELPGALGFEAEVVHWRGPSPFFFLVLPMPLAETVRDAARSVSYGWGMVPVEVVIGDIRFRTALFAKDGTYYLPLKDKVRHAADLAAGDRVGVEMTIARSPGR